MRRPETLVIDSSVAFKWISSQNENWLAQSDRIMKDCQAGRLELYAPELSKFELGNALLKKNISLPETKISLASFYRVPVKFMVWDLDFSQETVEVAKQLKITFYDASFLVLARKLNCSLVTDNPKHQKFSHPGLPKVISLKDYR